MKTHARLLRLVTVAALFLSIGIYGQIPRHRALLSRDLLSFEARGSAVPARVIVHGTRGEIEALAARHHISVVRFLEDSAIVLANSVQVSALAADTANDVLSGDVLVAPFMSVSNSSTAADQVRTGPPGPLGIGAR